MPETFTLRFKPKLEFSLNEFDFEIIDLSDKQNEGNYAYNHLQSVDYIKEKVNWFVTAGSFIFGLIMESGSSNRYKDRAHLKIVHQKQIIKIKVQNVEMATIDSLISSLNQKIISTRSTFQNI